MKIFSIIIACLLTFQFGFSQDLESQVEPASMQFSKNDDGAVESLTLHQGGQIMPGKKIE